MAGPIDLRAALGLTNPEFRRSQFSDPRFLAGQQLANFERGPSRSKLSILAKALQGGIGGVLMAQAREDAQAGQERTRTADAEAFRSILGQEAGPGAAPNSFREAQQLPGDNVVPVGNLDGRDLSPQLRNALVSNALTSQRTATATQGSIDAATLLDTRKRRAVEASDLEKRDTATRLALTNREGERLKQERKASLKVPKLTSRQQAIQDTMRLWKISEKDAQAIEDGLVEISTDRFGNSVIVNKATKKKKILDGPGPVTEQNTAELSKIIGVDIDPARATGASGLLGIPIGYLAEFFFGVDLVPDIREGKVVLDSLRRNVIAIGSTDVPGRPTDFARQLEDMLTIKAGSIFETDENAKRKLKNGLDRIDTEIRRGDSVLSRQDITPADRSKTVIGQEHMKRLRAEVGGLLDAWGKPGGGRVKETVTLDEGVIAERLD